MAVSLKVNGAEHRQTSSDCKTARLWSTGTSSRRFPRNPPNANTMLCRRMYAKG
jgi:hypothetical protein